MCKQDNLPIPKLFITKLLEGFNFMKSPLFWFGFV